MRPPLRRSNSANQPIANPPSAGKEEGANAERLKLARHLHEQGVNPLSWTEAEPAPREAQAIFAKEGTIAEDQFEVGGRLYLRSPAVRANASQAAAIAEAYMAEREGRPGQTPVPIESLVEVEKVPLQHPLGAPHQPRAATGTSEERSTRYRHYAKAFVEPANAHLGDPLPMPLQRKLKEEMAQLPPGAESRHEGRPAYYQGFDDKWIYAANDATREDPALGKIRESHEKRIRSETANENDATAEDAIVRYYLDRDARESDARESDEGVTQVRYASETAQAEAQIPANNVVELQKSADLVGQYADMAERSRNNEEMSPEDIILREHLQERFREIGVEYDPADTNIDELRDLSNVMARAAQRAKEHGADIPPEWLAAYNVFVAQALAGSTIPAALARQGNPRFAAEFALRRALPLKVLSTILQMGSQQNGAEGEKELGDTPEVLDAPKLGASETIDTHAGQQAEKQALQQVGEPQTAEAMPAEKMSAQAFRERLPAFDEVNIHIGDFVIKQHPHTTATDQVLIDILLDVASSRGCDPEEEKDKKGNVRKAIYGGDTPQSRITDIDQSGHRGSGQPDGTLTLTGHGNRGSIYINTTTSHDGTTEIARELVAAQRILANAAKQFAKDPEAFGHLVRPITTRGPILLYTKKWHWSIDKIRDHVRRKIEEIYDKLFDNCAPTGEPDIYRLDDPNDPEFNE